MTSLANEIKELFALHQSGALTAEEFAQAKQAIISERRAQNTEPPQEHQTSPVSAAYEDREHITAPAPVYEDPHQAPFYDVPRSPIDTTSGVMENKKRLILNIRVDRAKEAIKEKGEIPYFVSCFASEFPGDFLYGASKSLEVLEKVLTNKRDDPSNPTYNTLKLSNLAVRKSIVQQPGALEFLIVNHAELRGDGEMGYREFFLGEMDTAPALEKLLEIKKQFEEIKRFQEEERLKKAENVMRAAVQREARRLEHHKEPREETVPKRTKGESQEPTKRGHRVPLAEAVKYLKTGNAKN